MVDASAAAEDIGMGEVISLRQARKRREQAQRRRQAAENRVGFGRAKADRQREATERTKAEQMLEGHRLDDGDR